MPIIPGPASIAAARRKRLFSMSFQERWAMNQRRPSLLRQALVLKEKGLLQEAIETFIEVRDRFGDATEALRKIGRLEVGDDRT